MKHIRQLIVLLLMPVFCFFSSACGKEDGNRHILVVLADKNFFDPEYTIPCQALEEKGYRITSANISGETSVGIEGLEVKADLAIKEAREKDYYSLLLVGGYGAASLFDNQDLIGLIKDFHASGKIIGAQCYSPVVIAQAGLLQGRQATCWPDVVTKLESYGATYSGEVVEITDTILTAQAGSKNNILSFTDAYCNLLKNRDDASANQRSPKTQKADPVRLSFPVQEGQHRYTLPGSATNYLLFLPKGYGKNDKKWPLILFLHGSGERSDDLDDIDAIKLNGVPAYLEKNAAFPAVVLSPQCPAYTFWNMELDQLWTLLDVIEYNYAIDKSRVYLTGLSMGGNASWLMGLKHPERFAAIVPVAGFYNLSNDEVPENIGLLKDTPLWIFHGARDTTIPVSRSQAMIDALTRINKHVRFTIYPDGGHDAVVWLGTYLNPELYNWLLKQKNNRR
jgi:putative intracellular protease/amidase/predicted esterase